MKNPLQTFGPNEKGRDFVIGDLHGAYPCYEKLLDGIKFDPTVDRMFSVLDLVDRGPESKKCLQLLAQPYFHGVLSNHEHMMLEAFKGGYYGQYWLMNGGRWGLDALVDYRNVEAGKQPSYLHDDSQEIVELVDKIDELPFLITINHKNGKKFHILHAELPPGESGKITDEDLADPEKVRAFAMTQSGDGDAFLWARYLWWAFNRRKVDTKEAALITIDRNLNKLMNPNRSHVISGHTILRKPTTILNHTNIDTCAYGACETYPPDLDALTCIELDTWTFYQATTKEFRVVEPVVVTEKDLVFPTINVDGSVDVKEPTEDDLNF